MEKKYISDRFKHILHGGDYNPDQWQDSPNVLSEDMRLMKLAGCNAMSVGIFAWAALEPREGEYDFSFLDKAMDDIYENGGRVILATPSGARPAWLSQKYPEVLRTNADRSKRLHGSRHNHCFSSPVYREKVANINRRLAERYKDHPALLMWHISNEYGGECHCEYCREAFRSFLKDKYKTLDALNHEWWTAFWAHTYTDWSQIEPPSTLGESSVQAMKLDWRRFVTHQTVDFMKAEIAAVREFTPTVPVTTNLMQQFGDTDARELGAACDIISWDSYPAWRGNDENDIVTDAGVAFWHDLFRSIKHRPFMLMESTPSHTNWKEYNKLKRPGQHALYSLQAVAHGSDTVQYFQWRKSRGATEQFHGAVVDHVGNEHTRVFREVASLGARLAKLDAIVGTATSCRTALLYDYDNDWALSYAAGFQNADKKVFETAKKHYFPLWKRGINTDVIGRDDDLSGYDLIVAPMLYTVPSALEDKLEEYVRNGGTLLCTYTTGMVNENGLCHLGGFPAGKLKEVFGIWNEEIDTLYPGEFNTAEVGGKEYRATDYCELLHLRGARALGTYTSDFYTGMPAVTVNTYGKGKAYYIAFRDAGDLTDELTGHILEECGITSDFDGTLPYGVTAHSRTDGETLFLFLENHATTPAVTQTAHTWHNVESGEAVTGEISLKPYEVLILARKVQ
ncbi:MAG: beta-galactosidase [Ruminococcaceae bacterium]|nr:beta-galactosidase [Oscillospiraceae bacterium]